MKYQHRWQVRQKKITDKITLVLVREPCLLNLLSQLMFYVQENVNMMTSAEHKITKCPTVSILITKLTRECT